MYLLPKEHPATKKILDSQPTIPCDIYADIETDSPRQQIEDFMRFLETSLNKIKKLLPQKNTRVSFAFLVHFFSRK